MDSFIIIEALWKTHSRRTRKLKTQLELVDKDEEDNKSRKIVLKSDVDDLKRFHLPDMLKIDESFERTLISWISFNNLRKDLSRMLKEYLPNVKKAYKGNDTGKLRGLVDSNNYDSQQELLSSMKWHLSNIKEEYDAIEKRISKMLDFVQVLDTTLTEETESDLDTTLTE